LVVAGGNSRYSRVGGPVARSVAAGTWRTARARPRRRAAIMTWADFYLTCFAVGFSFSLLSFIFAGLRWHLHVPHFSPVHGAPHVHAAPATLPVAHAPAAPPAGGNVGTHGHAGNMSPFNFVTLTAFLAWFGGAGYLL